MDIISKCVYLGCLQLKIQLKVAKTSHIQAIPVCSLTSLATSVGKCDMKFSRAVFTEESTYTDVFHAEQLS